MTALPARSSCGSPLSRFSRAFAPFPTEFAALPEIAPRFAISARVSRLLNSHRSLGALRSSHNFLPLGAAAETGHFNCRQRYRIACSRVSLVLGEEAPERRCRPRGHELRRHWIV
jgi:hypothetical protein